MKLIGQGAQYRVFDTLDGRVIKHPLSHAETIDVVEGWYEPGEIPEKALKTDYPQAALKCIDKISVLIQHHPELASSLGNPNFLAGAIYTQDKVTPLSETLATVNVNEGKLLIDKYIELIIYHWRYGFCDKVFNFTINNGVNSQGEVILLDFGEVTFDLANTLKRVQSRRWLETWTYNKKLSPEYQAYYAAEMEKCLTIDILQATWASSLQG